MTSTTDRTTGSWARNGALHLSRVRRALDLNVPATLAHTRRHPGLRVYRGTRVRLDGRLQVDGSLRLGCQWSGNPYFHRGYLVLSEGSELRVLDEMQVFTGLRIVLDPGARLQLGSGFINTDVTISCFSSITVGDDVAIGPGVTIRDSDNHGTSGGREARSDRVVIGDHVWVGMGASILRGVTVGEGAVIAAGSLVNRDVPPATLVAGVPARVRRTGVSWTHEQEAGA